MPRVIDLTLTLDTTMPGVQITPARTFDADGWNAVTLHLYSHCGTHMDAPVHFGINDAGIDALPLERCIVPAWVVDVPNAAPKMLIEAARLGNLADRIQPGDGLIVRTGWSRRAGLPMYRDELPRISEGLARWCVEHKVSILAVEPPSVADVHNVDELTLVHRILLEGDVVIVEGLTNLDAVVREKVTFMAFPLKIARGDGAPARALAIEGDE